jgi:AcrR family transcriptional regulator
VAGVSEAAVAPALDSPEALFTKLSPGPGKPAAEVRDHQRVRIQSAMVELVADRGAAEVGVRDLVSLAKVSSKAFYSLFASKEECFLRTHELLVRRVVKSIVTAQAAESDWRERLRATFAAFIGELESDHRVARLLLIDAYVAGPVSLDQVRRAERTFEARIRDCFEQAPGDAEVSPLLIKGIASGMICLTRSRLLEGREDELPELVDDLTEWALSFHGEAAAGMLELGYSPASVEPAAEAPLVPSSKHEEEAARAPVGDRALILNAVTKLALSEGYEGLTVPTICLAAGISRRRFYDHYGGVDECFVEAAELHLAEAFARAVAAGESTAWVGAIQSSMSALCQAIATDSAMQRLGFIELFHPGPLGLTACSRTIERLYDLIVVAAEDTQLPPGASVEASAGAIWGLLHHMALEEGHCRPAQANAMLTLLALAPLMATGVAVAS